MMHEPLDASVTAAAPDAAGPAPLTLILGLGESGLAAARWCAAEGDRVRVADSRAKPSLLGDAQRLLPAAEFVLGTAAMQGEAFASTLIDGVHRVVIAPGLAPASPQVAGLLAAARAARVAVIGEIELFAQALARLHAERGYRPRLLAVTGTNGKTTVTALTGKLVAAAGLRVGVAGNIGPSALQALLDVLAVADAADAAAQAERALVADAAAAEAAVADDLVVAPRVSARETQAAVIPRGTARTRVLPASDEVASDLTDAAALAPSATLPETPDGQGIDTQADSEPVDAASAAGDRTASVLAGDVSVSDETVDAEARDAAAAGAAAADAAAADTPVIDTDAANAAATRSLQDDPAADACADVTPTHLDSQDDDASLSAAVAAGMSGIEALMPAPRPAAPPAFAAGLDILPQVWVLELSSFQLHTTSTLAPDTAAVLNLTEDHLDWHGSMVAYGEAKASLLRMARESVVNRDDAGVVAMVSRLDDLPVRSFGASVPVLAGDLGLDTHHGMAWLAASEPAGFEEPAPARRKKGDPPPARAQGRFNRLMPADALRIRGRHNALNAQAALLLARSLSLPWAPLLRALSEYTGEPHRMEFIRAVCGVDFIDDSKGTNVGATVAALDGMDQRVVLIAGGDGKGQDFSPLRRPVASQARAVVLIGRDGPAIAQALVNSDVPTVMCASLPEAVEQAFALAREGDAVLLSPACASLDMFRNYAHRSAVFVDAVVELALQKGEVGA